ncbi:transglutaminase-like domain-containing protein [Roseiconus lacunae]|uniref:Transglutaminase-like domain-containing protein n=1 Tax=Roseiconus lacunae TaxID=2605694 RepID=A0ABT7PKS3_9BACT|nr:transglutaminase-like domain-containing protein [Roseiconus lacunae]MDM4017099.1 transglutaminase-like domain-containing protein [Roseiconus lacunae]
MTSKAIHRRKEMISADDIRVQRWRIWVLPILLLLESIFVGSTFNTIGLTLLTYSCAALLVIAIVQLMGGYEAITREVVSVADAASIKNNSAGKRADPGQQRKKRFRLIRAISAPILLVLITLFGILTRVDAHVSANLNFVAMIVDAVAHGALFVSFALWALYPYHGHPSMLAFGLIAMLMAVTGGGVSHTINGQLVAALATLVGYVIGSEHILGRWQLYTAIRRRQKVFRQRLQSREQRFVWGLNDKAKAPLPTSTVSTNSGDVRGPMLFYVLAFSLLLMSTTAAGHLANIVVPGFRIDFLDRLSDSLEKVAGGSMIGSSRYVRGSRLGQIRRHMMGEPTEVALRAIAENAPGYLRGTVFDTYREGAWSPMSDRAYGFDRVGVESIQPRFLDPETPAEIQVRVGADDPDRRRFPVRKNLDEDIIGTVEIYNVPLKGQFVFSSLSTEWIEASVFGVSLTHHDSVAQGVDTQMPYVLGIGERPPQEQLSPIRKEIMMQIPPSIRPVIEEIAFSVCDGRLTPKSKAKAIEEHFQKNFRYSLNRHPAPREIDPVVHFLETQHPAHCEYFATGAAMMLRSVGVPTRYVTGYVANELSESGEFYVARNRDAHAWVEAYDAISGRWFPVEATVGRRYRTLNDNVSLVGDGDGSADAFLNDEDDQSALGRLIGWVLSFRTSDSLTFIFQIAQLPLFCMVVILLWLRYRRRALASGDPMEYESRLMLAKVDRQVRKFSLTRLPGETLHQFSRRIDSAAQASTDPELLKMAARWYRQFADRRYQGQMPEPLAFS